MLKRASTRSRYVSRLPKWIFVLSRSGKRVFKGAGAVAQVMNAEEGICIFRMPHGCHQHASLKIAYRVLFSDLEKHRKLVQPITSSSRPSIVVDSFSTQPDQLWAHIAVEAIVISFHQNWKDTRICIIMFCFLNELKRTNANGLLVLYHS